MLYRGALNSAINTQNIGMALLTGGMDNSNVNVTGDANMLLLMGGDIANGSSVNVGGDVGIAFLMGNILNSNVDINGDANMLFAFGDVDITGDMSGGLFATLFGDVTIQGGFSGVIGNTSTKPGAGNTLTVNGATAGGVVTPADAFAGYVGYP